MTRSLMTPAVQRRIFAGLVLAAGALAVFLLWRAAAGARDGIYPDDLADVIDLFGTDDQAAAELAPVIDLDAARR